MNSRENASESKNGLHLHLQPNHHRRTHPPKKDLCERWKMLQYLRKVYISRHRAEVNEDLYFAIKKIEQLDVFNCLPLLSTEFRCAGLTSWTEKRKKKENRGGNSSVEKKSRRFFVGRASAEKQASGADGGTGHVRRVSPRNNAACQKLVRNRVLIF